MPLESSSSSAALRAAIARRLASASASASPQPQAQAPPPQSRAEDAANSMLADSAADWPGMMGQLDAADEELDMAGYDDREDDDDDSDAGST